MVLGGCTGAVLGGRGGRTMVGRAGDWMVSMAEGMGLVVVHWRCHVRHTDWTQEVSRSTLETLDTVRRSVTLKLIEVNRRSWSILGGWWTHTGRTLTLEHVVPRVHGR